MPEDPNVPVPTPDGWPRFSQRLWSEEVGIANASDNVDPLKKDDGYEWSNGRKFVSGNGSAVG